MHLEQLLGADREVIGRATTTQDVAGGGGVIDAVLERTLRDVHADDFTQDQPGRDRVAIGALQLDDLRDLAFERYRAFLDARRLDQTRWRGRESGQREFIDFRGDCGAAGIHGFGQWAGRQVPDKLAGFLDVAQRVLFADAGEADDGRDVVEGVEEAVWREVQNAALAQRRDPADRTWADDGVERIVGESVALAGFVEMDRHGMTVG